MFDKSTNGNSISINSNNSRTLYKRLLDTIESQRVIIAELRNDINDAIAVIELLDIDNVPEQNTDSESKLYIIPN